MKSNPQSSKLTAHSSALLALAVLLATAPAAWAQRPYIGFVYPAGGQQGTTFQIKLGGKPSRTSTAW